MIGAWLSWLRLTLLFQGASGTEEATKVYKVSFAAMLCHECHAFASFTFTYVRGFARSMQDFPGVKHSAHFFNRVVLFWAIIFIYAALSAHLSSFYWEPESRLATVAFDIGTEDCIDGDLAQNAVSLVGNDTVTRAAGCGVPWLTRWHRWTLPPIALTAANFPVALTLRLPPGLRTVINGSGLVTRTSAIVRLEFDTPGQAGEPVVRFAGFNLLANCSEQEDGGGCALSPHRLVDSIDDVFQIWNWQWDALGETGGLLLALCNVSDSSSRCFLTRTLLNPHTL